MTIPGPKRIVLIRHGESTRNKAKAGQVYFPGDAWRSAVKGIPDHHIDLTAFGERQARETGHGLKRRLGTPQVIVHSGYRRTIRTMELLLEAYDPAERTRIEVAFDTLIRERDAGYTYEMLETEALEHFPWLPDHWKTFGGFFARPPGGESLLDVAQRVRLALAFAERDYDGKDVWYVTHGGTILGFHFTLGRLTYDEVRTWPKGLHPDNCGVFVYERRKDRYELTEKNQIFWTKDPID